MAEGFLPLPFRRGEGAAEVIAGDRAPLGRLVAGLLVLILIATILISVATGPTGFLPGRAITLPLARLAGVTDALAARDWLILYEIRLPRAVLGGLIGGVLAISGCVMQGLFRNPLADPGLVGVSSGAGLAAVAVIVLGDALFGGLDLPVGLLLPVGAFVGALGTTLLLYRIATRDGQTSIAMMLLAGIAIAALSGALTGLLVLASDDRQLRDVTFWTMGSLGGASWTAVAAMLPFALATFAILPAIARGLDAMLLGESEAQHLGFSVQRLKRIAIFAVAASVGGAVALAGPIGFIGILAPHLLRLVIGPRHALLLPASGLLGAVLLIGADTICRTVIAPAELPIGIVTALIGAPFFLWLLLGRRSLLAAA
ncbi:FecCD family ABC transporter permease [Faunimonas pinastri]|nr:iron chelate uptake ABC transporter family permease subunit [Faunimonas pinastri]